MFSISFPSEKKEGLICILGLPEISFIDKYDLKHPISLLLSLMISYVP